MASPVVNNNGGQGITANGNYLMIEVPGWITGAPLATNQPQFWETSYYILAGSTGVGTVCTFQAQNNDGTWTNVSSPAPITLANSTTYNSTIQAPCGGLRMVVSGLVGNGIAYAQLAGIEIPIVSGSGNAVSQAPKGAPVLMQSVKSSQTGTGFSSNSTAYAANVTAGSVLIAGIGWNDATNSITSVHDSLNAANWTLAGVLQQGNGISAAIYYLVNTLAGACTVTLTLGALTNYVEVAVIEVSSLIGAVDVYSSATGTAAACSPGSITTTGPNEFLVSYVCCTTHADLGASGWTFTQLPTSLDGFQYQIAPTVGTFTGSFTIGGVPTYHWSVSQVAFK